MPITGTVQQDEASAESSNAQNTGELSSNVPPLVPPSHDVCPPENTPGLSEMAGIVSSTTMDPDEAIIEETSSLPTVESSVATTSQTDVAVLSDNSNQENNEDASKVPVSQAISIPSFSQSSGSSFQSAFAAFASASSQIETEAMEVDDSYTHVDSEVASTVSQEEPGVVVEQSVTSAIDSGLVTTTQESLVTSGDSLETQQIQPVTLEQDTLNSESDIYTSSNTTVASEISPSIDSQPIDETQEAGVPSSDEVQLTPEVPSMDDAQPISEIQTGDEASSWVEAHPIVEPPAVMEIQPVTEAPPMELLQCKPETPLTDELHTVVEAETVSDNSPTTQAQPLAQVLPVDEMQSTTGVSTAGEAPSASEVPFMEHLQSVDVVPSVEKSQPAPEAHPMEQSQPITEGQPMEQSQLIAEAHPMEQSQPAAEAVPMDEPQPVAEAVPMNVPHSGAPHMDEAHFIPSTSSSAEESTNFETLSTLQGLSGTSGQTDIQSCLEGQSEIMTQPTPIAPLDGDTAQPQPEETATSDAVFFIQMADSTGEIVTSIIDPNDISSYSDSVVYKQCMGADGQIETTIANSGSIPSTQVDQPVVEDTPEAPPEVEQQVIYAHDLNGHLTPIDSAQSATDVAPPGKQFVYMQDSSGRIIRTIMDANQTMVPGQQVYYTQSDDGRIITSVMDSGGTEEAQQSSEEAVQQQQQVSQPQQAMMEGVPPQHSQPAADAVTATSAFAMDNSMSGLNMLAELSHLTAGQASSERKDMPATDNGSQDTDMDEFRPVAMITRRVAEDGVEVVKSSMANLKFSQETQNTGPQESVITKLVAEMKTETAGPADTVSRDNLFVQWQNLDAMCWMDVVLVMLVYSPTLRPLVNLEPSHELASTLLITLLKANRQAQVLLQNLLKNSASETNLQTGAGNVGAVPDVKSSKLVCKENMDEIGKAINILYAMREKIWQALQPRLRCERGKHNSPVLVLPLLVREKPIIKQMFTMNYRYVFKCAKCGYSQDDSHSKILPTIPAVPPDFNMREPCFVRNCFECHAPAQRMRMKFEGLQDFVQMHFVKGLPHSRFDELSFDHNGDHYEVTGIVHYKNNPDHFIAWVRNAPSNSWMECDDLKSVITRYQTVTPNIPPSQVHMVMWERRLTPTHTLVMRDTEDTKYLASLVLTVQQPTSSQPNPDTASMNQKKFGTPLGSTTLAQAGPASTVLSGLISQSQSSLATPRGRGRGSRGPRTPRGGITIRRAAPLSNTQMATPRPSTSTQIIRLPVSALPNVNSSLRGNTATGSPSRYILVGGNNAQATSSTASTGSASKVVVLRSQGGSGSLNNLSATQLLQLLQQSGALSQGNTRISTQITKPSSISLPQTQTMMTKLSTASGSTEENAIEDSATVATSTQQAATGESKDISVQSDIAESGALALTSEMATGVETQATPSEELSAVSSVSNNVTESQEMETAGVTTPQPSTSLVEPTPITQTNTLTSVAPSGTIRTLSMNPGEPTRYIQIPNSSGGGNIVTQVVMKGGKMVLVPVDKNTQTQPTSTPSIIRLPGASLKSSQLNTSSISNPTILQSNTSSLSATATTSTLSASLSSPQYTTMPGNQGSGITKKIQFITVPRGSSSAVSGQPASKTIIVSPSGGQTPFRIVTDADSVSSSPREIGSQAGNIVIRELKRSGDVSSPSSTVNTMASLPSEVEIAPTNVSSNVSTVSLLRDVNLKPGLAKATSQDETATTTGESLFSSSPTALASKPQESFKYILPGSSMHQMSSIQNMGGPQSGPAFTALSSSGTIIGGQLTPTTGALAVESVGDGTHTIYTAVKEGETTILRGQGRGRGQRGRGRGVRARGRGRRQSSDAVSVSAPLQSKIIKRGGTISMLSADFRQVGGQIIESASEDVDGVPVVSIPDFSAVNAMQTETLSAAESLTDSISQTSGCQTEGIASSLSQLSAASMASDPMIITQSIPSIKGNHGFDILTQGILGATNQSSGSFTPRKSGISLLTGKPVVPSSSLSTSITLEASKTQQSLAMGQSVTQNEIETLIKAAQGAAKPPKPGQQPLVSSPNNPDTLTNSVVSSVSSQVKSPQKAEYISQALLQLSGEGNSVDKGSIKMLSSDAEREMKGQNLVDSFSNISSYAETGADRKEDEEERVVNVDESQVSAAERYRMPTELFQPDDESPEKPIKSDILSRQLSGTQILGEDLPSKLFQDSEISSQEDDASMSPHRQPKSPSKSSLGSPQAPVNKVQDTHDMATPQLDEDLPATRPEADMEVESTEEEKLEVPPSDIKSPVKRGRKGRGKGKGAKGKGRGGRRKSASVSDAQESYTDTSPPPPDSSSLSLSRSVHQVPESESGEMEQQCLLGSPDMMERRGEGDEVTSHQNGTSEIVPHNVDPIQNTETESDMKVDAESAQESPPTTSIEYKPAFVYKRPKVSWDEENYSHPPCVFSYKVLTRNSLKPRARHPSLGPQPTSFMSAPEPLPPPSEKCDMRLPLNAIVVRRQDKALERPIVDPSKEPTVIPLVAEEDGDPACTGGSVVTSHTDGEVFTGVIVHQRREMADWSCGLEDDEEEGYQDDDGLLQDKDSRNEYAETLWTAMCMEVGDFTVFDHSDSESVSGSEGESISDSSIDNEEESVSQSQADETAKEATVETKSSPSRKRSAPDDDEHTPLSGAQSPKHAKVATSADSSLDTEKVLSSADNKSSKVEEKTTRVNGISSSQPASNHTGSVPLSDVSPLPPPVARASEKTESFVSPARRSSRTPVPSFKIRDYVVEDKPMKSVSKVSRRSSVLSSDDDLSGYQSDELHAKKGKKKSVKAHPVSS